MHLLVENLTLSRGERTIIRDLSFRVDRGGMLVLSGPNGSGKTTLLRAMAGLLPPDRGRIALADDKAATEDNREPGERCHFIGHLDGVKGVLTIRENAEFWADFLGGERDAIEPALERLGLLDMAPIQARLLSTGQRRRLGLSRLLLAPRPLWLLDEPTASLDAESRSAFAGLVSDYLQGGGIVVAATHVPLGIASARELRLGHESITA